MIKIAGAGLAGLVCAFELARCGAEIMIYELANAPAKNSVARYAGGMLAPWCESESTKHDIVNLGADAINWWAEISDVTRNGTLVLARPRDRADLTRFSRHTSEYRICGQADIDTLEPELSARFNTGLFFHQEAHLNPRRALHDLTNRLEEMGVNICYNTPAPTQVDIDCTGSAAKLPGLRAVRGEMAILYCPAVTIRRTVRLLHPRIPFYIVPHGDGYYMVGATSIESSWNGAPTLRSLNEILSAAFALHPALAEAEVSEIGAGLRPAFPDNMPRIIEQDGTLYLNGLYRHGFLFAPMMAAQIAQRLIAEVKL